MAPSELASSALAARRSKPSVEARVVDAVRVAGTEPMGTEAAYQLGVALHAIGDPALLSAAGRAGFVA